MMGDELVKAEILPPDNANLGRYLPVTFDHKAIRADKEGFVDRMVAAFEERDLLAVANQADDLAVDREIMAAMNEAAGRDPFYPLEVRW